MFARNGNYQLPTDDSERLPCIIHNASRWPGVVGGLSPSIVAAGWSVTLLAVIVRLIALSELQLKPLVLTAEEIRREPRRANANLVWSYNDVTVPIGLRMRILQALLDEGPMPFGQLLKSVAGERDPAPAVMALASANLVHLDLLAQPLSPTTLVRCSPQADNA